MVMNKPSIAIKLSPRNYTGLIALGNLVHTSMTGNANFATPAPALATLLTAITEVSDALAARGNIHNHGTTADMIDLRQKARTLHDLLTAEADYVTNSAQLAAGSDYALMASIIITSGFSIKSAPNPQGLLWAVRDLRRMWDQGLNQNQVKLEWSAPENVTSKNNLKSCIVFRSNTPVFSEAEMRATVSANEFTDTNTTGELVKWYYFIVPVGSAGNGAVSDVIMVSLPPM